LDKEQKLSGNYFCVEEWFCILSVSRHYLYNNIIIIFNQKQNTKNNNFHFFAVHSNWSVFWSATWVNRECFVNSKSVLFDFLHSPSGSVMLLVPIGCIFLFFNKF
jgi:hypothetical protein